jgi:hypothetical protein
MRVAVKTTERKILKRGFPAMLARDYVIDLKRRPVERLRHPAIFASPSGALPDLFSDTPIH